MTDKEKALAYDKLLVKAKQIYNKENDVLIMHTIEDLFPDLKESEDERIRKHLISLVKNWDKDGIASKYTSNPNDIKQILAWLEKQCTPAKLSEEEQNRFAKGVLRSCAMSFIDYLDAHKYEGKMCVSNGECEDIENAFCNAMWDRLHRYYCKYTEEQNKQKPDCNHGEPGSSTDKPKPRFKAGQTIVNIYHNPDTDSGPEEIKEVTDDKYIFEGGSYIMISEQDYWKLDGESKFKPGEWIAHNEANFVFQIISVGQNAYEVVNPDGYTKSIPFKNEEDYHLWTIHDVKDGDLVVEDKIPKHPSPFIAVFKAIGPDPDTFSSHCFIDFNGNFNEGDIGHDSSNLHPATKEQRDLLFKKMHEAEYELDAEKLELKKVEVKEVMCDKPKFKAGDWIVFNGLILFIKEVVQGYYRTISVNGIPNSYDWNIDNAARLWTIQDAKEGNVLAIEWNQNNDVWEKILIFKALNDIGVEGYGNTFKNKDLSFTDETVPYYSKTWTKTLHPATKEQRDLLFSKMKEGGYEWSEETKELEEIEQNPDEHKFHEGEWVISNTVDKDYRICKITGIKDGNYTIESTCGYKGYNQIDVFDKAYRPWTIEDVKDGEVLAAPECYVIFKEIAGLNIRCYCTYHYMGFSPSLSLNTLHNKAAFHPATKEESDTLGKAITNGGLKWNAEKKEFTAIKPKFDIGDTIQYNGLGHNEYVIKEVHYPTHYINELGRRMDMPYTDANFTLVSHTDNRQEWSEEEKGNVDIIISRLEVDIEYWKSRSKRRIDEDKRVIDWLKSLRSQNTWKPSKEQIIALRWVLNNVPYNKHKEEISGLLDQIKEL